MFFMGQVGLLKEKEIDSCDASKQASGGSVHSVERVKTEARTRLRHGLRRHAPQEEGRY